jgi:leucyl-tRNA---protein transferase
MSLPNEQPLHKLQFYVTTPYKCGYLPNKLAQSLIASPQHLINASIYNGLISQGFRRSGKFAYRPHCESCRACIAVRLILSTFAPTRGQKRACKQHADLTVQVLPLHYNQDHFELYSNYQSLRHHDENTLEAKDDEEQYRQFLCQSNVESLMIEFRDANNQTKIVSVIDVVKDGVSAVYTFYDALETKASYGTYAIMWLAEWTKNLNLPYLYLGYWIQDSQKMAYKQKFNPQEKLIDGEWQ